MSKPPPGGNVVGLTLFSVTVECCAKCQRVPLNAADRAVCLCGHRPMTAWGDPEAVSRARYGRARWTVASHLEVVMT